MLTAIEVRNAKPKEKPYKMTDGRGLFLHIATSGKKTWRYRFTLAGTESVFVLGEYPAGHEASALLPAPLSASAQPWPTVPVLFWPCSTSSIPLAGSASHV